MPGALSQATGSKKRKAGVTGRSGAEHASATAKRIKLEAFIVTPNLRFTKSDE
jgi:hypothetical protein